VERITYISGKTVAEDKRWFPMTNRKFLAERAIMNIKKFLFPSLAVCAVIALIHRLFAKPASAKPASKGAPYDAIDTYVEQQMHRLNIPGVSLAIVEGDRIVHYRGFGRARPGGEEPSSQTPFFIGSLTKSITALAVMQLVEAGKVELDAPVQRYLPWFRVADPQASAQMTVRHLLNQTSGLPLLPSEVALADFDDRPDATERQVRALSKLKLTRPVGSKCEYSNFNYNILGLIVEVTSGEAYAEYIQKHIFDPLEMHNSYTSKAAAQKDGLAVGHRHWFSFPFPVPNWPVPSSSLPSGQLISSAEDLAHYLVAHLNGGRYGDTQILSSAGIDQMHRGVKELKMGDISGGFYGMGWFDIDLGSEKTYSHGGNVPDFSAFMALVPEQKVGAVLLLNADPYGLPIITEEIGMGVTALLAGQQPAPIRLDFIQWIMRLLPLIPLLQVMGVFATLRLLRRWRQNLALRPSWGRMWGRHILLPLIPNLSLAAILVYLRSSGLLRFMHLFLPDLAWIARISGRFAGLWAFLRTGLILRALRKA
jgi:CubicO group peptidase (beta-lactamase class C family)